MGWADCGVDSQGRPIGYAFDGKCDHDGCDADISRGLDNVCGRMHGNDEYSCEKYFCDEHRANFLLTDQVETYQICDSCKELLISSGEWYENEDGEIVRVKE